jgi:hypothetical protein
MSESEYEDGSGDDGLTMETDSLEDLRVWCRKSAVLFTVLTGWITEHSSMFWT